MASDGATGGMVTAHHADESVVAEPPDGGVTAAEPLKVDGRRRSPPHPPQPAEHPQLTPPGNVRSDGVVWSQ